MSAAAAAARPFEVLSARLRAGGPSLEEAPGERAELALRMVAFAALAAFVALHWSALVAERPVGRVLVAVGIAAVAGPALALVPKPARDAWRAPLARAGIAVLALGAALAVLGLPGRMLPPAGWGELGELLGRGLTGMRTAQWPYSGPDEAVRLTLLAAIPPTVMLACVLGFWPRRRARRGTRPGAAVVLLALYGVSVAQLDPGEPLVRGAILLLLTAALLLLPRVRPADAPRAGIALLVAAALAVPLTARLPGAEPVIDYTSWRWVGDATTFEWDHSYGPIDWPRKGDVVMTVESERPHYWRAVTLDAFDGFRWARSLAGASTLTKPDPPPSERAGWYVSATFTVGALVSEVLVSPGAVERVEGVEAVVSRDGTVQTSSELDQGQTYTVESYAPNPSVREMRAAPDVVPATLTSSTLIQLPDPGAANPEAPGEDGDAQSSGPAISLPARGAGAGADDEAVAAMRRSPYARTYELARRLAAPAPTTYDAVRRIEAFLRARYSYSERPPERQYPIDAFLFEDRAGYCQQFAGAMALMLRMNGIPSRVVAGFAPGVRTGGTREFTVRDVDAHSWVEVHFAGIGWVPFDPTPPDAPADSQSDGSLASAARGSAGRQVGLGDLLRREPGAAGLAAGALQGATAPAAGAANPSIVREASAPVTAGEGGLPGWRLAGLLLAGAMLLACSLVLVRAWAAAGRAPDADVRELAGALRRLGHRHRAGSTLLELERRLERSRQRDAARYVRRVRERRFGPSGGRPPDSRGRRALRRSLTRGGGARGLLRGYLALPPRRV
jgi:hypothetical protein